jgi:hypothetical protein
MALSTGSDRATVDADQFAALTNLLHVIGCWATLVDPEEAGDILYRDASPLVCDDCRMAARAILVYLGIRFAANQPVHEPGSGCRFAAEDGTCDFHDARHANANLDELADLMRADVG